MSEQLLSSIVRHCPLPRRPSRWQGAWQCRPLTIRTARLRRWIRRLCPLPPIHHHSTAGNVAPQRRVGRGRWLRWRDVCHRRVGSGGLCVRARQQLVRICRRRTLPRSRVRWVRLRAVSRRDRRDRVRVASTATRSASTLDKSIVNINTTLSGGQAAGTGIIISSSGLVLTNNHVIADSTSLQVENSADGSTHTAKVLGYDVADDVALVQIQNVSGLTPAPLGNSSNLSVGDAVVALGNAGGQGGSPSVVTGSVTATEPADHRVRPGRLQRRDAPPPRRDRRQHPARRLRRPPHRQQRPSRRHGRGRFKRQRRVRVLRPVHQPGLRDPDRRRARRSPRRSRWVTAAPTSTSAPAGACSVSKCNPTPPTTATETRPTTVKARVRSSSGVQSGSAAEAAGITQGDVITAVDGTNVGIRIRSHPCHEQSLTR